VLGDVTGLPVLGVVSETWLDKHRMRRRAELIRYSVAAGSLLVVFVCILQFRDAALRVASSLFG
jgi:hypothetical protein